MNPDKSKKITGKVLFIMKNVIIKQTVLGQGMPKICAPYLENGKLEIHEGALRLTREGIFISDSIMSDLLWVN